MSGNSSGEKTEQPTPKRLRDARKKGQVALSKDFASSLLLCGLCGTFAFLHEDWGADLRVMVVAGGDFLSQPFDVALGNVFAVVFAVATGIIVPIVLTVIVVGVLAHVLQTGPLLAFEALKPDLKKLNPVSNAKNLLGKKKLLEFLFNILKVIVLSFILFHIIRDFLRDLLWAPSSCGLVCIVMLYVSMVGLLLLFTCLVFVVVGAADLLLKRKLHIKELMMTKDEVKREFKEMEGDPHIKSKRKQMFQEIAMNQVAEKVKTASVIVTNPRHIAVALYYDKDKTPLPVLLAKGEGGMARLIIKTAEKEGIPIMQNVPLARELYRGVEVDHYIPSDMIEEIAAVFRWLQQIKSGDV
ncbi:MAG: type III secretion system export apparatus subunit SctU [Alphaproteobacteria bacterium GM202ARS2]|nr:type III secretion system export apparatus subunit SctU [Alphaproteobacteria bacterium GM202ARS2]